MSKSMACVQIAELATLANWTNPPPGTHIVRGTYAYIYIRRYAARSRAGIYIFKEVSKIWGCNEWGLAIHTSHTTYHATVCSYTNIRIYVATYILIFVYHT